MKFSVFFRTTEIAELVGERGRLRLRYLPEVVAAGEPALSLRLPIRSEPYLHDDVNPFFANLLPEDEHRHLLARVLGLSDRNVAGLLGAIGGECAGAVSIWPSGEGPPKKPEYVALSGSDIRRLLEAKDAANRLNVVKDGRLSLAGGMEKLCLRSVEGRWARGRGGAPTTHILKWAPASHPDLSLNELFCLELLREIGLPVVDARLEGERFQVLVVKRFDRTEDQSRPILPVHQEDFCQALGVEPSQKYQAEGGPSVAQCAEVLGQAASVPARERQLLLRWVVANFMVGNCDAHGKNIALLYGGGGTRLAPFYDVVSTRVYPSLSRKMSMAIGKEYRIQYVRQRHWERMAESLGVRAGVVVDEALRMSEAMVEGTVAVTERLVSQYGRHPVFRSVADVVARHGAQLRGS